MRVIKYCNSAVWTVQNTSAYVACARGLAAGCCARAAGGVGLREQPARFQKSNSKYLTRRNNYQLLCRRPCLHTTERPSGSYVRNAQSPEMYVALGVVSCAGRGSGKHPCVFRHDDVLVDGTSNMQNARGNK